MKLVNFASLDPAQQRRNIAGLKNASQGDREIFAEFFSDWERLAFESEQAAEPIVASTKTVEEPPAEVCAPEIPTERDQIVRVRLVQRFFRGAVHASYGYRCTVCRVAIPELVNASYIIPWSADRSRRADPTNGLAMCAFHDRAFDRGLLAVSDEFRILVSLKALVSDPPKLHRVGLLHISGQPITMPDRFHPDRSALHFHRKNVFSK